MGSRTQKEGARYLTARFLLDTHIAVRWLVRAKRLSREQVSVLRAAIHRHEPLAVSAITLIEIAVLRDAGGTRVKIPVHEILDKLGSDPFHVVPIDLAVASEAAALGGDLRDPADRTIVATARVHRLRLVTSDQRIY